MKSRASIALLPLIIGVFAAGAGYTAMAFLSLSPLQAVFTGASVFCLLTVLVLYFLVSFQIHRFRRRMDGLISFEDNITTRLQDIERDSGKIGERLGKKIDRLAKSQQALSLSISEQAATPAQHSSSNFDADSAMLDGNVVQLKPSAIQTKSAQSGTGKSPGRKSVTGRIDRALNGGEMTIRLQPILNLIDKEVVGLEAFAFFKTEDGFVDGREFTGRMTQLQSSRYDLKVTHALSSVIREMSEDGQALPIHYRLVSMASSPDANWLEMAQALESDPKLLEHFVPVVPQSDYLSMSQKALEKFLNLREFGFKPCLDQVNDAESALEPATLKHFQQFKVNAETLLKYHSSESERFADHLLPGMLKANARIFVADISSAHQASQLIDLDLVNGQGNYICKPKRIRLYKEVEDKWGEGEDKITAEDSLDRTS